MATAAPANSAPTIRISSKPRIVLPQTAENLAGTFLPRRFTVSRAEEAVRCSFGRRQKEGTVPGEELPLKFVSALLVVLAVEEARDIDRLAAVVGLALFNLRLGRATGDVRHALEQSSATTSARLRLVLILRRSDRRSADRRRQDVVAVEQQLIGLGGFRRLELGFGGFVVGRWR